MIKSLNSFIKRDNILAFCGWPAQRLKKELRRKPEQITLKRREPAITGHSGLEESVA